MSLKDVTQSADLLGLSPDFPKMHRSDGEDRTPFVWTSLINVFRPPTSIGFSEPRSTEIIVGLTLTGTTNLGLPRDDFLAFEFPSPTAELMALVEFHRGPRCENFVQSTRGCAARQTTNAGVPKDPAIRGNGQVRIKRAGRDDQGCVLQERRSQTSKDVLGDFEVI